MDKKPKKPSTYDMLKRLDKKVQQNKSSKKDDYHYRNSSDSRKKRSVSPRNQEHTKKRVPEIVIDDIDHDIPDRSFGDLYCKACDSHMNSEQMWEAHIQGKRHQKNTKRGEQGEQKYEVLREDPLILPEIKKSEEPIIGLQHCCEIRRPEGKPTYQCFLCSANVPNGPSLIEHVIGLKHRMAYLKEHDPVKHGLIDKTNLKKGMIEPVVAECIRLHQDKHGTGRMQVKLDKAKPSVSLNVSYKKPYQDAFDNNMKKDDRRNNYPDERDEFRRSNYPDERDEFRRSNYPDERDEFRRSNYPDERDEFRRSNYPDERDDPRRNNYPNERDEDYRYLQNKQKDFQRSQFSDHPYEDRYSYSSDKIHYPPASQYNRDESAPLERRSPSRYENRFYETSCATEPPQKSVFDQKQEKTQSNLFQSLLKIIETMPSMMFLELVLHRVENMNPTETELSMLQKIGNHMISIVMNKKLQKLSPDLLDKYHNNTKKEYASVAEQSNKSSNNLNSLMSLVSQFNSAKTSSFNWESVQSDSGPSSPAFMTQTPGSFYSSSSVTEIPGLTLSDANVHDAGSSFFMV